jgi:branched-subunit amino acid aminotransferase/4-amino-4-deoxychorismate lyase
LAGVFVTTSAPLAVINGAFVGQAEAHLALHDAGFVWGATVTDLVRTFGRRLFRLADHLKRFRQSCTLACVPQPLTDAELADLADRLVAHNAGLLPAGEDLILVLLATPGPIGYFVGQAASSEPTLILHTYPLPIARYAPFFAEGARLRIVPVLPGVDPRIKQRSRLAWWLAEQEARQVDPGASALGADPAGHVTETAAANLLLVRGGVVLSPPRSSILEGISLQVTEELCRGLGIPFREQPLTTDDCFACHEALLCSTPYGVAGVRSINGHAIPWPGLLYGRLCDAWEELTGIAIRRQILPNR